MKTQSQKSGGFQDSRIIRQRVANGEIPKWLIDKLVSVGYEDPRKEYRLMTIVNVVCSLVAVVFMAVAALVLNTALRSRTVNFGPADIIVPGVTICLFSAVAIGYLYMRGLLEGKMIKKTKRFDRAIEHLICSPRPQFTSASLVTEHILFRSVQNALVDLAARKVVFLEYEKTTCVGMRKLSEFVDENIRDLFDVSKEIGLIGPDETYGWFFQQAEVSRVRQLREDFKKRLAGLKDGEQPPLFW